MFPVQPAILQHHDLCYSTLLAAPTLELLSNHDEVDNKFIPESLKTNNKSDFRACVEGAGSARAQSAPRKLYINCRVNRKGQWEDADVNMCVLSGTT